MYTHTTHGHGIPILFAIRWMYTSGSTVSRCLLAGITKTDVLVLNSILYNYCYIQKTIPSEDNFSAYIIINLLFFFLLILRFIYYYFTINITVGWFNNHRNISFL
jgi:hypothetical protein